MSMKAIIAIERFSKSGRRTERREQPCRSFLLGLIQILYVQHAQLALTGSVDHIRHRYTGDSLFSLSANYQNLIMASPGGRGLIVTNDYCLGDEIGIQIGTGTRPVDARDRSLDKRICPTIGRQQRALRHPGAGQCFDLAWDGAHLWAVDRVSPLSQIYCLDPFTGDEIGHIPAPGTSWSNNYGLTWDGTYLWVSGYDSGLSPTYRIYQVNPADGAIIKNFSAPNSRSQNGLAWDGTYLWTSDSGNPYQVHCVDPATGSIVLSITPPYATSGAYKGLAYDGTHLWGLSNNSVRPYYAYMICRFSPVDGSLEQEMMSPIWGANSTVYYSRPHGLAWDGDRLWLSNYGERVLGLYQLSVDKTRFDYGGCEVVDDESYVNPNGSFTLRRYFTNKSGASITVNETGIYALSKEIAVARDVITPGLAVGDGETLKVEYAFQITV